MSFFSKITKEFGDLGIGGGKQSAQSYQSYQSPPPAARGYGEYGYHAPNQGPPPPAQYYAVPPTPTYQPPTDKPPLPQGWIPLFEQGRQRWYYANQETGQTQWEAPGYIPPRPPMMDTYPSQDSRGGGGQSPYPPPAPYGQTQGSYGAPPAPPTSSGGYASYDGDKGSKEAKKKSKSGKGGLLLGAAGGIAAGVAGGALLHHVLEDSSDSDEERPHSYAAAAPPQTVIINNYNEYDTNPSYSTNPDAYYGGGGVPGILPATDAQGNYVSESDRESVQEAREEYEEALAKAQDSSASSSDYEELAEAREGYEEEYEETYD